MRRIWHFISENRLVSALVAGFLLLGAAALLERSSGEAESPRDVSVGTESPAPREKEENSPSLSPGEAPTEPPAREGVPTQQPPQRDGNSRFTAKRLTAGKPLEASLSTEDDEDWYVYRASQSEDVHLEFAKGGPDESATDIVTVWEEQEQVESEHVAPDTPLVLSRALSAGDRLYVKIEDGCSPGCGQGPYFLSLTATLPG